MRLIRKQISPTVKDNYGIEHPYLTVTYYSLLEDKMNKWLEIGCRYYHTRECNWDSLSNFQSFTMRFDSNSIPPNPETPGWPSYDAIKTQMEINDQGQIVILNPAVYIWILNQPYYRDFEGKIFAENWEIID